MTALALLSPLADRPSDVASGAPLTLVLPLVLLVLVLAWWWLALRRRRP